MGYTAEDLLKIAAAEIGYKEKETNSQLDNPTANAGDGNFTKYARDLAAAGYYQASKQGFAWCDMFVDWCFLKLCGSKEKAEDMICQTGLYGAGCEWSARYYRDQGRFFTSGPKPGDQIFFNDYAHTGIVEKIVNGVITTIEGNTSNMVARRTYSISSGAIDGYGRPKYDVEISVESVEKPGTDAALEIGDVVRFSGNKHYTSANTGTGKTCRPGTARITAKKDDARHKYHLRWLPGGGSNVYGWVDAEFVQKIGEEEKPVKITVNLPVLKNGSTGESVKAMQLLLIGNGCSCGSSGADGKFGTSTENAVMMYRDKNGLTVSGVCDSAVWEKLLGE